MSNKQFFVALAGTVLLAVIGLMVALILRGASGDSPIAGGEKSAIEVRRVRISTSEPTEVIRTVVDPGGEVIEVVRAGDVGGLRLTIEAGAYDRPCELEISSASVTGHSGLQGFNPISPVIMVETEEHYADVPVSLRIPVEVPEGHVATAFYYEAASGRLEALPTIVDDDGSVVCVTRHFSQIIVSSSPEGALSGRIMSGFEPGNDDWAFPNRGTVASPRGICSGMSISAMWYFVEQATRGEGRLHGRFDNGTPDLWEDDVMGLKLATMVQKDSRFSNPGGRIGSFIDNLAWSDRETYEQFANAIQLTGEPQLIGVTGGGVRHMMIVYGTDDDTLLIADPNRPGESQEIRLIDGEFEGYEVNGRISTAVSFIGQSAFVRWDRLGERWGEAAAGTIGEGHFPDFSLRGESADGRAFQLGPDAVLPTGRIAIEATREGNATLICDIFPADLSGRFRLDDWVQGEGPSIDLAEGDGIYGVAVYEIMGDDNSWEWMGFVRLDAPYVASESDDGAIQAESGDALAEEGGLVRTFAGHGAPVWSVAFSPDGRQVLSGSWDSTLKLWDIASGQCIRTFTGHGDAIISVAFSPDGSQAISGSADSTLKLWDIASGQCLRTSTGHSNAIMSVAFSPDGSQALSGGEDRALKLWDLSTGQCLRTFTGHGDVITSAAFSPDGRHAISGSTDGTLKLWDIASGQCLHTLTGYGAITSAAFSPDGRHVLSGGRKMEFWDVTAGRCVGDLWGGGGFSVAFGPDGRLALDGGSYLSLWDVATGRRVRTFTGHSSLIASVAFSPDGSQAISGSRDNTLKLWRLPEIAPPLAGEWRLEGNSSSGFTFDVSSTGQFAIFGEEGGERREHVGTYEATVIRPGIIRVRAELSDADPNGGYDDMLLAMIKVIDGGEGMLMVSQVFDREEERYWQEQLGSEWRPEWDEDCLVLYRVVSDEPQQQPRQVRADRAHARPLRDEGNPRARPSDSIRDNAGRLPAEVVNAKPIDVVSRIINTEGRRPDSTFEADNYDHSGLSESPPREERRRETVSERWGHMISTVSAEDVACAYMDVEDDDAEISADAMLILAQDREKANEELFLLYLCDETVPPQTRANAAYGLGQIGAVNASPYLLWAMQSEHLTIRRNAYAALQRMMPVEIVFDPQAPTAARQAQVARIEAQINATDSP